MDKFTCYSDGGANNITKSDAYGSFAIFLGEEEVMRKRFLFVSAKTSNEAEFLSLIGLLDFIATYDNGSCRWDSYVDSRLVYDAITGRRKIRADNLKPLYEKAKELFGSIDNIKIHWVGRKKIFEVLGH